MGPLAHRYCQASWPSPPTAALGLAWPGRHRHYQGGQVKSRPSEANQDYGRHRQRPQGSVTDSGESGTGTGFEVTPVTCTEKCRQDYGHRALARPWPSPRPPTPCLAPFMQETEDASGQRETRASKHFSRPLPSQTPFAPPILL